MRIRSKHGLAALAVATTLFTSGTALAAPITVGGVTWDPGYALDFMSSSLQVQQKVDADGTAHGFGIISTINGTAGDRFCPGCTVTFQYRGYTPASVVGNQTYFMGGFVDIYVYNGATGIDPADPITMSEANTGLGTLWLSMRGHAYNGSTLIGTATGSGTNVNIAGLGQLDVVGGVAREFFDTNRYTDGSDLGISTSFTRPFGRGIEHMVGTGNFFGSTARAVPEPGTLALVGLGFAGLLAGRRQRPRL
ncbi:PEP-CTERM sorting domain-containing protein [Massilia sp. YMA4]|uniref:PEP-CTERM sorting domain-containing protein n=1 Tax=Massilia sp. YMA4 TaxID=1593482 RepID=UPI000DD10106|nr:PEP-CTERM sorting domain-containing protein [Massilia sp. YMA4]AXA93327.1 hypothetical protein DPH57_20535 [Massilia sp. YMA4]